MKNNFYTTFNSPIASVSLVPSERTLIHKLAFFIYVFCAVHILAGLILYYGNLPLFLSYVTEDGYIEYLTAFFLLMTSLFCLIKSLTIKSKIPAVFFGLVAFLFFFGFGEEISWAQRLFAFETPENLEKINTQHEFNLHNIQVKGVRLNKLIFGLILYTGLFVYFLGFNFLYLKLLWFRKFINSTKIPLPAPTYSLLFLLSILGVQLIQNGEKWELDEFAIACLAFLCFLRPYNEKLQQRLVSGTQVRN